MAWPVAKRKGELPPESSLFELDSDHVIIEAVKRSEDGRGVVVRMYEAHRCRGAATLRSHWPIRRAELVNLLEQRVERLDVNDDGVRMEFRPFEIKTVKLYF
jgi:alpha-mannosidase